MTEFIVKRLLQLIPLLFVISLVTFFVIELPPGDYLTSRILRLREAGGTMAQAEIDRLTAQYGLDKPVHVRYFQWIWNIVRHGNFGWSFEWDKPVSEVIGERIALTMVISVVTMIFVWAVSIPIGIFSATRQYSALDYAFTFGGFIGLATPNFLLALVLMYVSFAHFGVSVTGLFSPEFADAAWSWAKVGNMLQRLWIPVVVVGTAGTAGLIRVMRGCLLDELNKDYVTTARAKGMEERKLVFKYPVRVAINPLISTIGWLLPSLISGETLVSIVLNLPTTGPVLLRALVYQDMYLAGSFVLILSALTVIGTVISDILLAWLDPRIRYEGGAR